MKKSVRNNWLIFLLITGLWIFFIAVDLFIWFDLKLFDIFVTRSPQPLYDTNIVVIEYDDKTADNLKAPFSVTDLAGLVQCIEELNPKAIGLDLFSVQSELLQDDSSGLLAAIVSQYSNIALGAAFIVPRKAERIHPSVQSSFDCNNLTNFVLPLSSTNARSYYYIEHILKLKPDIMSSVKTAGHLNLINDIDGICRRIPGFISCSGGLLPSFGLQGAMLFLNTTREKSDLSRPILRDADNRSFPLPMDEFGQLVLRFHKNQHIFREIPIIDFLSAYKDSVKRYGLEKVVKDKLVFIGNVSLKSGRFFATSFQPNYPAILIHATIARNLINQSFIRVFDRAIVYALLIILGILIAASMIYIRKIGYTFWILLYIPILLLADSISLVQWGTYLPLFSITTYIVFLFFLLLLHRYIEYKNSLVTSLENLQQVLIVKERLATIGQVTAQTAHAIRNPLGIITLYTSHLRRNAQTPEERSGFLDIIDKEVSKLNSFLTNLMDLTKPIKRSLQPIALREMLEDVQKCLLQYMKNKSVTIDIANVSGSVVIHADPNLLRDVFINLGRNSIDAIEEKGTIQVSATKITEQASILFKDTGKGMTEEEVKKAFNLFFTTKKEGNGLGLPMVKNIIEAHRGSITLESTFGKGTEVKIQIP